MGTRSEIPPGTLYMLVLKTLARLGSMHGYGIAQYIQQTSDDVLQVEEGSLYPALQRMLIKGWVDAEWKQSENNRRARFYKLSFIYRNER
jgi:PadR family transcriptional regulator PadR